MIREQAIHYLSTNPGSQVEYRWGKATHRCRLDEFGCLVHEGPGGGTATDGVAFEPVPAEVLRAESPLSDSARQAIDGAIEAGNDVLMLSEGDILAESVPGPLRWRGRMAHWVAGILPTVPDPMTKVIADGITVYAIVDLRCPAPGAGPRLTSAWVESIRPLIPGSDPVAGDYSSAEYAEKARAWLTRCGCTGIRIIDRGN